VGGVGVIGHAPLRYLSICSGIEAASLAWEPLGWEAAAFAEVEPFPSAVLAHRFPTVENLGDVLSLTETRLRALGPVDVLVGGTPCQSFSVAGNRGGLCDARGRLALAFAEVASIIRPRWVVWENVPGVLSSAGGWDFASFVRGLVDVGYRCAWRVLDAQGFGVPQRRRRVFVVGCLGDGAAARAVLALAEGGPRDLEARGEARSVAAGRASRCAAGDRVVGALTGSDGGPDDNDARAGRLIVGHVLAGGSGWRGHRVGAEEAASGHLIVEGDSADSTPALPRLRAGCGRGGETYVCVTGDRTHALCAEGADASEDGTGRGTPIITQCYRGNRQSGPIDVATAVNASGSRRYDFETEAFVVNAREDPIVARNMSLPVGAKDTGHVLAFSSKDYGADAGPICPTLRAGGHSGSHANGGAPPAVLDLRAFAENSRAEVRLEGGDGLRTGAISGGGGNLGQALPAVFGRRIVRRLTPMECERLQGMPDGWTQIPWNGRPAEACPDGPRYKAIGNSMAVVVMRWIGLGIVAAESAS